MLRDFKEFALRGNVVDMAIGILIGGAFTPIAKSLADDVIMPPIGLLLGDTDFTDRFVMLSPGAGSGSYATLEAAQEAGAVTINFGVFLNACLTFLIVAFAAFLIVNVMNDLKRKEQGAAKDEPTTRPCPYCASTIPLKATRCPQCTSDLGGEAGAAPPAASPA